MGYPRCTVGSLYSVARDASATTWENALPGQPCGRLAPRRYLRRAPWADASIGMLVFPWHLGVHFSSGSGAIGQFVGGSFSCVVNGVLWAMEGGRDVHGHDSPDFEISPLCCSHYQVFVEPPMGVSTMPASRPSGWSKLGLSRAPSSVNSLGFAGQLGPSRVPQRYLHPIWSNVCYVQ